MSWSGKSFEQSQRYSGQLYGGPLSFGLRLFIFATAIATTSVLATGADYTPATARSEIHLQFAELLVSDGRYWEAIVSYENAKYGSSDRQLLRALVGQVQALLRVAEFPRAHAQATSLRKLAPNDPMVLAFYGDATWAAGLFEEAEESYKDALSINPEEARAHNGLAKSLATKNRLAEAMTEVHAALGLSPNESEFHHTLGSIQQRLNQFNEAADSYEKYIDLHPHSADSDRVRWARAEVDFLRSFGDLVPYKITGDKDILHRVSFKLDNGKVILRARVNGQAEMDIVLDTGAERTVFSQEGAERVGLQSMGETLSAGVGNVGLRDLQVGRLDSIEFGTLRIENLPTIIKTPPLGGLPTREAESFSPLAAGLSMMIDYKMREVVMGRALPIESTADIELPLRMHRLAMVRGVINGDYSRSFVVDTGGAVISLSRATAATLPHHNRNIPLKVYGTSGWDPSAYLLTGVNLTFDQIERPNQSVVVLNLHHPSALLGFHIGGIVGHSFLRNYRVSIDLNRSVLILNQLS